jgi:glutamate/tyrosine decarboxylase-like PLP-dependent enzyme
VTAHAAFDKAAALMDIQIKHVPLDPVTLKVDIKAMKRAITRSFGFSFYLMNTFQYNIQLFI